MQPFCTSPLTFFVFYCLKNKNNLNKGAETHYKSQLGKFHCPLKQTYNKSQNNANWDSLIWLASIQSKPTQNVLLIIVQLSAFSGWQTAAATFPRALTFNLTPRQLYITFYWTMSKYFCLSFTITYPFHVAGVLKGTRIVGFFCRIPAISPKTRGNFCLHCHTWI